MANMPFQSFSFTLISDKRPRAALRMTAQGDDLYELQVQKGSASNPTSQFKRTVPLEIAERLRDAMQEAGVFGWEESYGDTAAPGSRRWSLNVVFQEGVFALSSKGGSDAPAGFDDLLEELYRLDFPRPGKAKASAAPVMPTSVGDLAAYASKAGLGNLNSTELQQRMKDEFRHMSRDEQNQLLDMLASTGMASRDWWERFLRG